MEVFMINEKNSSEFLSPFSSAYWKRSASELKSLRSILICALLIAVRVALKSVKIPVGDSLSIYVGFLVNSVSGAVCGPVLSLISGAVCDILGWLIAPAGPFMPLFTLIEMFCAFCYSICLYSTKINIGKIALSKALVNIFGNIVFSSFALSIYYEKGVLLYLLPRIAKNILMLPIEIVLLVLLFNALTPLLVKYKLIPAPQEAMVFKPFRIICVLAATVIVIVLTVLYFGVLVDLFNKVSGAVCSSVISVISGAASHGL